MGISVSKKECIELNYTPIHVHSDCSLLDSCTDFNEYVDLAVQYGQTAIASTEHGKPLNWVSKKLYCEKNNIKFLHGVEIYLTEHLEPKVRDNYHTILIAKNEDGVRELNRLVSMSTDEEHSYYTNRISFDEFLQISDNIISTSACLASPLNQLPEDHPRYMELAQKYDYFEIQPHNCDEQAAFNKKLYALSGMLGTPLVAGTDTHSSTQYKAECRKILLKAKHKSYGDEDAYNLTYRTYDELCAEFQTQDALPKDVYMTAIANTNVLADSVEDFRLDTSIKYPILHGSREKDAQEFTDRVERMFAEKVQNGIIKPDQVCAFREAIDEEMRVFRKLQMDGFMLSMSELICWCKDHDIAIGTARGSVGGSRVAYVTDIIDLNPEQWRTVFSRFCNEDREEIGDIDIDLIESDRPAVFQHIVSRFGIQKTARVASYGTIAAKGVIEDTARALRQYYEEKHPGKENPWSLKETDKIKQLYDSSEEMARKKYPELFYYFNGLIGTRVSQSVHPAGMVISPISLDDNYGVFRKDGDLCLMLDMDQVHDVGLAKYDFLILKTVQVIRDTCCAIGVPYPRTYQIDWDDQKVWEDMVRSPVGIFQFEGSYAYDMLKQYNTRSIFDMSLVTACIRPSGASYRDELIAHKPHKNPSELIDNLLSDNGGYLVYQEDIIKFLQQVCGLSGSEADNVRRGIARKKVEVLEKMMPKILDGYCNKSDKPRDVAEKEAQEFLQIIEDASSYMFG